MRLEVLYLEDNEGDAFLLRHAFEESRLDVQLKHFGRAAQALVELYAHGADLVVLDLLLPSDDRSVIVNELAASPRFRDIPVVVLTGWDVPAYELVPRAVRYDRKPPGFAGWMDLAQRYVAQFEPRAETRRVRWRGEYVRRAHIKDTRTRPDHSRPRTRA